MIFAESTLTRRKVIQGIGASAISLAASGNLLAGQYHRADATWLSNCRFGISSHWTAQSKPVSADDWLPFEEAVSQFNPARYADQVANAGAEYVIFTGTHALQMLPAPCAAIDRILPGRTTHRDLIGELADACHARGLRFILYYNHSCNGGDDPDWEYAVGYHARDKSQLISNLLNIIRELGTRYKSRVAGWWFDSCGALDPNDWHRDYHQLVTTDMHGYKVDWDQWVDVARIGFADRLVTLNPGGLFHYVYSRYQDYEAGEAFQPIAVPTSQFTQEHLQGHRWICLDNSGWVHNHVTTPLAAPMFNREYIESYVRDCNRVKVPVTFNVDIDRTGLLSPQSLQMLHEVRKEIA